MSSLTHLHLLSWSYYLIIINQLLISNNCSYLCLIITLCFICVIFLLMFSVSFPTLLFYPNFKLENVKHLFTCRAHTGVSEPEPGPPQSERLDSSCWSDRHLSQSQPLLYLTVDQSVAHGHVGRTHPMSSR